MKKTTFCFTLFLIGILFCGSNAALAQHHSTRALTYGGGGSGAVNFSDGWGAAIGTGIEIPQGDFNYAFKPSINFNASVYRFLGPFTASLNLGYTNFKPDEYFISEAVEGSDSNVNTYYADMPVISAYGGLAYNIDVADNFRVYGGVNLGLYFTEFAVAYEIDDANSFVYDKWSQSLYYAPKVGIIFPVTPKLGISIESKYNFFSQKLTLGEASAKQNWSALSLGAQLVFKF
ncbi:hypothetical protein MTO98_10110 [Mucilaginibacter sp. SMC90]|uniref:outer membrane beta-barrel protein n=1 Tax=Mucilaginibacter sp. SMC90 TaxID=2929803 RepID=UPI001FB28EA1|nr:outer membrane beta-barrel protein [Mucilaginibacter sp. SMC90]UOE51430.1 hypothetical protein MTO98_10110 [Mucilaginibacter sp. SMC90]